MKAAELREMSVDSLKEKLNELEENYFNLRFQAELGQLENPLQLRDVRRDIARTRTIIRELVVA